MLGWHGLDEVAPQRVKLIVRHVGFVCKKSSMEPFGRGNCRDQSVLDKRTSEIALAEEHSHDRPQPFVEVEPRWDQLGEGDVVEREQSTV